MEKTGDGPKECSGSDLRGLLDEPLKARFMSEPKEVLKEQVPDVPDGNDLKVVENADNYLYITLPAPPPANLDLSDDELGNAAGRIGGVFDAEDHHCGGW